MPNEKTLTSDDTCKELAFEYLSSLMSAARSAEVNLLMAKTSPQTNGQYGVASCSVQLQEIQGKIRHVRGHLVDAGLLDKLDEHGREIANG